MKRSLREIAEALEARLIGDGSVEIAGVSSLESASPSDLVFVDDEKHLAGALQSRAGAIIAGEFASSMKGDRPLLISDHPKLAFARAARMLGSDDGRQHGSIHAERCSRSIRYARNWGARRGASGDRRSARESRIAPGSARDR